MSNYTLAVNWSGKDTLADSDAAKVISGSEFNTEFTTVRTAVNSKANLNGASGESFALMLMLLLTLHLGQVKQYMDMLRCMWLVVICT